MTDPETSAVTGGELRAVLDTYDPHFDALGGAYDGIPILDGLHFLYVVRGDRPPEKFS